jgi:hypothetical protein
MPVMHCRCLHNRYTFDVLDGRSVVIGRDPVKADVVIPYFLLNQRHARFANLNGEFSIEGIDLRAPVYVNERSIRGTERMQLQPGDHIWVVADVQFVVEEVP